MRVRAEVVMMGIASVRACRDMVDNQCCTTCSLVDKVFAGNVLCSAAYWMWPALVFVLPS